MLFPFPFLQKFLDLGNRIAVVDAPHLEGTIAAHLHSVKGLVLFCLLTDKEDHTILVDHTFHISADTVVQFLPFQYDLLRGMGREHHKAVRLELVSMLQIFLHKRNLRIILLHPVQPDQIIRPIMRLFEIFGKQHKFIFQLELQLLTKSKVVVIVGYNTLTSPVTAGQDTAPVYAVWYSLTLVPDGPHH